MSTATATPTSQSDRPEGMVQVPLRRSEKVSTGRRFQSLFIFVVFSVLFGLLGYQVVTQQHVVPFEALDRLSRATMVWYNDPPKLAAIGLVFPPLNTLIMLPFAIFKSLTTTLVALPVVSAMLGGFLMLVLNRLFERADMPFILRLGLLLLVALSPMTAFYASNGSSSILALALLTLSISCIMAWFTTVDTRYLIGAGMAFSMACLADYGLFLWMLFACILIGAVLRRHLASRDEIEGSLITFLAPSIYVIAAWTLFNFLILGKPFAWITDSEGTAAINTAASPEVSTNFWQVAEQLLNLVTSGAPMMLFVLPALILAAIIQRNEFAGWLAVFSLLAVLAPAAEALIRDDLSQLQLSTAMPMQMIAIIGAAWLYKSATALRLFIMIALIAGLVVTIPLQWRAMDNYKYQNMEQAFKQAIVTGDDQEGTVSKGGLRVGILSERAMALYIKENVPMDKDGVILTDNSQTFGAMVLTGNPSTFFDRVDQGDAAWEEAAKRPPAKVKYFLIAKNASADRLRMHYPRTGTSAGDARLPIAYDTPRYVLVRVPAGLGAPVRTQTNPQAPTVQTAPTVQSDAN